MSMLNLVLRALRHRADYDYSRSRPRRVNHDATKCESRGSTLCRREALADGKPGWKMQITK